MAFRLPDPIDPTPMMDRALQQRLALMQQPTQTQVLAPLIAKAFGDVAQGANQGLQRGIDTNKAEQEKRSLMAARQAYSDYLSKVDSGTATPQDHQIGVNAALSLGLPPPKAGVAGDIWGAIQKEGGFTTKAPGTPENVQAGEVLARLTGSTKDRNRAAVESTKQKVSDEKFWATNMREFNPSNARRGTLLGQAALGNSRADRALVEIQKNPTAITPQLKRLIEIDLAGIMQGGSPHVDEIAASGYPTIAEDFARLRQKLSGNPSKVEIPQIISELKNVISTVKEVDNKIILGNMDMFETANSEVISRHPDKWNKLKTLIRGSTYAPGESAPASGIAKPGAHDYLLDKYGTPDAQD